MAKKMLVKHKKCVSSRYATFRETECHFCVEVTPISAIYFALKTIEIHLKSCIRSLSEKRKHSHEIAFCRIAKDF